MILLKKKMTEGFKSNYNNNHNNKSNTITMKNFKSIFVALMVFVGATSFVNAQSKIAHIDTQALLTSMPEMKTAQGQLEKLQKTYDVEIKTLMKEFETKLKQWEVEAESKTDEENAKRGQEAQGMQNNIAAYR